MFQKAKTFWQNNKEQILYRIVVYGGIAVGIAAVSYVAAARERETLESADAEILVIHEN